MSTVATLADPKFEGRAAGSPGGIAARAWILERFKAIGLHPVAGSYVFPFKVARTSTTGLDAEGANVLGMCVGKDPTLPMFVVSAHYDHLGIRDGVLHPGADDNASGVAVMLEVAAYCQKNAFRRSIVFAAFDAEEGGLNGAKMFISTPPVPKARIALNVNLDMVSRSDKRELFIAGTYHTPSLKPPLEEVAKRAPITVRFGHDRPTAIAGGVDDWTNQSDHGPFHAAKIPFVYFGVEDHPDYHKPTDTADKINRGFFVDVAETILDAIVHLDRSR
jgi:Zn-dependent M28 family amino/carboxypeptidase